jgi:hypothetical protein
MNDLENCQHLTRIVYFRGALVFQKSREPPLPYKILDVRSETWIEFHTKDPHILWATTLDLISTVTWHPVLNTPGVLSLVNVFNFSLQCLFEIFLVTLYAFNFMFC